MDRISADIVIVGGGIMGCATAHALTRSGFSGSIIVIERDPAYQHGSTGRSVGGIRQQFSTPENIRLSQYTIEIVRNLESEFGYGADAGFREQGYLILASAEGRPVLLENAAVQRATGATTQILGPSELATRFPWLTIEGLTAGGYGPTAEGWLDPASLRSLFRKSAAASGARFINGNVTGIARSANAIQTIQLDDGRTVACGTLIIAAGAWSGEVAQMAALPLPVAPKKRFVFAIDCRDATEDLHRAPLTVDPTGVYFRPEGRLFICGCSPGPDEEPEPDDLDAIDHTWFEERVWPALATRVPAFEAVKVVNAWAGYYDDNALDHNAIIGPHPDVTNVYFITGFSGHGIQHAAGTGRALAELIVEGRFVTIDLTRLGYDRIVSGNPLRERNVI